MAADNLPPRRNRHVLHVPRGLMDRIVTRVRKPPGAAPGTLQHTGPKKTEVVRIRFIDYTDSHLREETVETIEECFPIAELPTVTWVNVDGLHEPDLLASIGSHFDIHRLVLEDVLSPHQRPKVEGYDDYAFVVLKMLSFDRESGTLSAEQLSLIVGDRYVFSFQERPGDVFEPVRQRLREAKGRIRSRGPDYLAYALVDAVVDNYFHVLEGMGDQIEELEELALADPDMGVRHRIYGLRREMLILRRSVWPLRESLGTIYRGEVPLMSEETQIFFRDVYDHAVHVIDTVETLREVLSGAMDLYLSGMSNRMNEVMKVLTIIATIFIPLSFFAGLYGMNFEYMPELKYRWAYPALLAWMLVLAGGMLVYFRRKDWL
ncbi:MAG: magnesium/cobalt transporter CorA [Gemmatimonadota bacterium]